ncbi:hypothetical protein OUZ56_006038 [Daphnia magna]|uniref:Uncharacterized protein n=1 Tax=Daphnia magna TaxID=35525 RepID=A0ABQ9YUF4_9CRUS|nr:hypothetical protein OUZ56_006038 [Daphnia magna]
MRCFRNYKCSPYLPMDSAWREKGIPRIGAQLHALQLLDLECCFEFKFHVRFQLPSETPQYEKYDSRPTSLQDQVEQVLPAQQDQGNEHGDDDDRSDSDNQQQQPTNAGDHQRLAAVAGRILALKGVFVATSSSEEVIAPTLDRTNWAALRLGDFKVDLSCKIQGKAYSSINMARSMLSGTLSPIDSQPVGQHYFVMKLMKGIYNSKPPEPRLSRVLFAPDGPVKKRGGQQTSLHCDNQTTQTDEEGVDPSKFKAHSTQGAAASKAVRSGIPVDIILKTAHWSREAIFTKFHSREVASENISEVVLGTEDDIADN